MEGVTTSLVSYKDKAGGCHYEEFVTKELLLKYLHSLKHDSFVDYDTVRVWCLDEDACTDCVL
jgi:hypothetical protein